MHTALGGARAQIVEFIVAWNEGGVGVARQPSLARSRRGRVAACTAVTGEAQVGAWGAAVTEGEWPPLIKPASSACELG